MDLRDGDLGLLITLDALLRERSVTRAAERLHLSQPAVSARLARLRALFDDPLLVGNAHGMQLTARASELAAPLARQLSELAALVRERETFEPATAERTFRIAATDYLHFAVSRRLVTCLTDEAPGVRIAMLPLSADHVAHDLRDNRADLAIASARLTAANLPAQPLYTERMVVLAARGARRRRKLRLATFCAAEFALVSPAGGGFHGAVDETLETLGCSRRVVVSLPSFLLALDVVRESKLWAVVPERLAASAGEDFDVMELPFAAPTFDVVSSWHQRLQMDPGHRWLRERIATLTATK